MLGDYACHGEEAYVFAEGSSGFVSGTLRGKEIEGVPMGEDKGGIVMGKRLSLDERSSPNAMSLAADAGEIKRD